MKERKSLPTNESVSGKQCKKGEDQLSKPTGQEQIPKGVRDFLGDELTSEGTTPRSFSTGVRLQGRSTENDPG